MFLDKGYENVIKDYYADLADGNYYQKLLKSDIGNDIINKKAFTFLLNTDGISLSKKSKSTIWPLILVINELPVEIRFCIENIIIAGN